MVRTFIFFLAASLLLTGWPVSAAAQHAEFIRKADELLHRAYFFHAWREADHTVDGDDWSLPDWVRAERYSGISINAKKVPADFPGRIQHTVRVSWREIEPREGEYDFSVLRERILAASENGKFAVKMGLGASVWETRYFRSVEDRTIVRTAPGTAPQWLVEQGVPRIEERPNKSIPFQVVNLDICYLHLRSASRGEEGSGPNPGLGQLLDEQGYLVVDEQNPLIKENRASGDENEEYSRSHELRFGSIETWQHRYKESMLRVLQMRRNFVWAEGDAWLVSPPLLHYVALELGKNARNAPDAWCYLRESRVPDRANKRWKDAVAVKNFERWVYQRDVDGARTVATEKTPVPEQMFEYHKEHLYDHTARKTSINDGQGAIQFAVDETFLSGGPRRVAVKITYLDRDSAQWNLDYFTSHDDVATRTVRCGNSGKAKTVTFLLDDAFFPGLGTSGRDLLIRATHGDAVIRFLRVIERKPAKN